MKSFHAHDGDQAFVSVRKYIYASKKDFEQDIENQVGRIVRGNALIFVLLDFPQGAA